MSRSVNVQFNPTYSLLIQGFGKNVTGGEGHPIYTVYNSAPTGAGSMDAIISACSGRDARIYFAEGLTYFDMPGNRQLRFNVTIDGFSNGNNGIRMDGDHTGYTGLLATGPASNIHVRGINFRGNTGGAAPTAQAKLLAADSDGGTVDGFLVERCTFNAACDGSLDLSGTGTVQNVTVQQCLFVNNPKSNLIKFGTKSNISWHHNVIIHGGERNPQARGDVTLLDYVNNIIFQNRFDVNYPLDFYEPFAEGEGSTDPYGILLANMVTGAAGNVTANLRGNCFIGDKAVTRIVREVGASWDGIYWDPEGLGADNNHWEGTAVRWSSEFTGPFVDWVGGPPRAIPTDIPVAYQVARHSIAQLKDLIPSVGCPLRYGTDQARIDTLLEYMP